MRSSLSAISEYGIDPARRRVFLCGAMEEPLVSQTIKNLLLLDSEQSAPVELVISSLGGEEYEMFGLLDVIESISSPVITISTGKCMSAAVLIAAAGDRRWATSRTYFMVHDSSIEVDGRLDEQVKTVKHYSAVAQRWIREFAARTGKSQTFWREALSKPGDYYFTAAEAVDLGVIDGILDSWPRASFSSS